MQSMSVVNPKLLFSEVTCLFKLLLCPRDDFMKKLKSAFQSLSVPQLFIC